MLNFLQPKLTLTAEDLRTGLRALTLQGTTMMGLDSITSGGFLAAYALALGASNAEIGMLAALPFILQPLQIPAVAVVERIRKRKQISLFTILIANAIWIPVALIPFFLDTPGTAAITMLLVFVGIRSAFTPFFNVPWLSWMKDLVPGKQRGSYFANRLKYATALGMVLGVGGAVFADYWRENATSESAIAQGFAYPILIATLTFGALGWYFMAKMPEVKMAPPPEGPRQSLVSSIIEPVRDPMYKHLLRFKFLSTFAMQLAIPFFAVYMIQVIGLPVSAVMGLLALSQLANISFLGPWGRMVDRFGAKPILSASVSLYLLVILGWSFTTLPDRYVLTIPLLVLLHIMAGIATAGMNVTHGTIAMKLSPEGKSTTYLATSSLAISLGAGLGPLVGGVFADFFDTRSFRVAFEFISGSDVTTFTPFFLTGFDFLFAIAFLLGLVTLGWLALVKEEGEVSREEVMAELMAPMRGMSRPMSSVPGLTALVNFPIETARRSAVPGLDVAVGVAAYQAGETARVAAQVADASERAVDGLRRGAMRAGAETEQLARFMLIGSLHSVSAVEEDSRRVLRSSVSRLLRALGKSTQSSKDAAYGAGYGALESAVESGTDLAIAAEKVIAAAHDVAQEIPNITPEEAVAAVSQGLLDASLQMDQVNAEKVRKITLKHANHPPGTET